MKVFFWGTKTFLKKLKYRFLIEATKIESTSFPFKTALSEASVKTNRMVTIKWTHSKEWSFASNYFIFLENFFQLKNFFKRVNLMYQRPKCPYSFFRKCWSLILESFSPVSILGWFKLCASKGLQHSLNEEGV